MPIVDFGALSIIIPGIFHAVSIRMNTLIYRLYELWFEQQQHEEDAYSVDSVPRASMIDFHFGHDFVYDILYVIHTFFKKFF